jgi:hypothetical protein
MDINGQIMQANVASVAGCTIKSVGKQDNNTRLEITIDTMGQTVDSPNGISGGPIKGAMGRTFTMIISPEGKEVDMSGAEQIIFNTGSGDTSNAVQYFDDFFPDLPAGPIAPGFTWSTTDSMNNKTSNMIMRILINSENKFEGFEKIGEINCAKITSVLSGTRDMKTRTQGMDIKMYGPFTGNSELFFAPSEGYFIKQSVTTRMQGTMEMVSPESFTIPLVMTTSTVNEIRK